MNRELLDADFIVFPPIPSLFERQIDRNTRHQNSLVQALRIGNLNLKIDSPAEWICQFGARPKPVLANGLLKHQFSPVTFQIGEALFRTGIQHAKSKQLCIKAMTFGEIRTDKFGDELGAHGGSYHRRHVAPNGTGEAARRSRSRQEIGNVLHSQAGPVKLPAIPQP